MLDFPTYLTSNQVIPISIYSKLSTKAGSQVIYMQKFKTD